MSYLLIRRLRHAPTSQGFVLPSAIFLLVILAALAAFLVTISTTQNMTSAQDVQGSRALQSARAGIEWGLYQVMDPANATVQAMVPPYGTGAAAWPNLPACAAGTFAIEGFNVTVTCAPYDYTERGNNNHIRVYHLVATANLGVVGAANFVERQVSATVSKCRTLDGAAPDYACP